MICLCCDKKLEAVLSDYTFYCDECTYWASNLVPHIGSKTLQIEVSDAKNTNIDISHLDYVRRPNFEKIIQYIRSAHPAEAPSILDIGCGPGLFMIIAKEQNCDVIVIEPNTLMYNAAHEKGLNVRKGFFPEQLRKNEKFDFIIMNDVFEHLENNVEFLKAIPFHLNKNGKLLINVPSAKGLVFVIGKILQRFGFSNIWDRLWQKMFYTPHLHYFTPKSLKILLHNHGFQIEENKLRLKTLSIKGLWRRLSVEPDTSILYRIFIFCSICVMVPILKIGNPDSIIITATFKKLKKQSS